MRLFVVRFSNDILKEKRKDETMIQKDWRNRLRLLKKDKVFRTIVISGIVVPSLLGGLIVGDFSYAFTFFGTIIGTGALMVCIYDVFFAKESAMGMEKNKKEQEKNDTQNYQEDDSHKLWEHNKMKLWKIVEYTVFWHDVKELQDTISYILEHVPLSPEKQKYFSQDFPSELIDILHMFEKLHGVHREQLKDLIRKGIEQKKKEWEELYTEPFQKSLQKECTEKVEQVFRKQEEKVYLTD